MADDVRPGLHNWRCNGVLSFLVFLFIFFPVATRGGTRELRRRRRGFECTLFATAVKSLRSGEEARFCKIKAFYSNRMYSYGEKWEKRGKVGRDENSFYLKYFSSRHYEHNHLSVPSPANHLFIDEALGERIKRQKRTREAGSYNLEKKKKPVYRFED